MFRIHRLTMVMGALLIVFAVLPLARPAHAQDKACFPQTNHCIEGRFLDYWRQNGGLAVFGYPVAPAREERNRDTGKTYLTQWFERNRFELHPENARPYDVLLGRLGDDRLRQLGVDWRQLPGDSVRQAACLWFPQTQFNVCNQSNAAGAQAGFRNYWQTEQLQDPRLDAYGRSLALFGLPLTRPRMETNASGDTVLTQWFERARFEWHPNNPPGFRVQLGLLGNELQQPAATQPTITYIGRDGVVQERLSDGTTKRIGATPVMDDVLDAVRLVDRVIMLRGGGLQSITTQGQVEIIAPFTQGNARFGELIAPANSAKLLYGYNRAANTPMSFEGVVGVIENGSRARKVRTAPNNITVLGLSTDEQALYLIDRGQDPAFGQVTVVALDSGATLAQLPFAGENAAALAPNRQTIATATRGSDRDHPNTVTFYDLANQTGAPRNVALPRAGWNIWQLVWAPDSRAVYAVAAPSSSQATGELWRVDPITRHADLMATNLPTDTRLLSVSSDGRWLEAQVAQGALVIDLSNGRTQSYALPPEVVIARWR